MDNKALCKKHGVTVHKVGVAFTCWPDGSPIPAADLDKFLVATPADVFDEKLVDSIPLAETYDEAQAFAVKYLDLKFDEKDFRPKYIRYTDSASTSVVHASVPVEGNNTQVECEALCGTLIYPPDEGDPGPEFLQDAAVDCVKCKTVLEALSCIRAPELIVEVMHTYYRTTRDPEADRKWRRSLGLPDDVTAG